MVRLNKRLLRGIAGVQLGPVEWPATFSAADPPADLLYQETVIRPWSAFRPELCRLQGCSGSDSGTIAAGTIRAGAAGRDGVPAGPLVGECRPALPA
jgi:hypothetical protein